MRPLLLAALLFGLGPAGPARGQGCDDVQAIARIDSLLAELMGFNRDHAQAMAKNLRQAADIARGCGPRARRYAARHMDIGIEGDAVYPTVEVAEALRGLCGPDPECVQASLLSLSPGISSRSQPTSQIVGIVLDVLKQAPTPINKKLAADVLRRGLDGEAAAAVRRVLDAIARLPDA